MKNLIYTTLLPFLLLCSCNSMGGGQGYGVVAEATAVTSDGTTLLDVRTNGEVTVMAGGIAATAQVRTPMGIPLLGPRQVSEGKVIAYHKGQDIKLELAPGAPLPAWTKVLFLPGQAEALGYSFEGE